MTLFQFVSIDVTLSGIVFVAGLSQLANLPAMLIAPKMLGWKDDLAKLQPINRAIVIVLGIGMSIVIVGSGIVVMVGHREMANGSTLGMALACFLAVVWTYRGLIQIVLYTRLWPKGILGRFSHIGLGALFVFQAAIYWVCFLVGISKKA